MKIRNIKKILGYILIWIVLKVNIAEAACDFTIPKNGSYYKDWKIDNTLVRPWSTICLEPGSRNSLKFVGLQWTKEAPIIIKNKWWLVDIESDTKSSWLSISNSRFIVVRWDDKKNLKYGIKAKAPLSAYVINISDWSSDVTVHNVELYGDSMEDSYAAIWAKTNPSCDSKFVRWKFEMKNIDLHDIYVHDINQWFYVWYTFFDKPVDCWSKEVRWHTMQWVKIYNNIIERVWQDWLQVSSATSINESCKIYNNIFRNTSLKNLNTQKSSITVWGWSKCDVYNNISINSFWPWILFFWYAGSIYNNLIVNAWLAWDKVDWIFIDDRSKNKNWTLNIYDNTIINPARNWIRFYNKEIKNNQIHNNLIVNPWSLKNTPKNHWSIKENWSYIYLEKWRIDRKQINNWESILKYLHISLEEKTDNLWLTKITETILNKIKKSSKFWVNAYREIIQ